jgi:ketosteroid isomerase-like protein
MRAPVLLACLVSALLPTGCATGPRNGDHGFGQYPPAPLEPVLAFVGGRWFTGADFEDRTAYAVDGLLTFAPPERVDSTIHLAGGYVVPPFGEAHNHNVEHSSRVMGTVGQYLQDGVFYVKNPNNLPRSRDPLAGAIDVATSIDVAFANGGLTASDGHPIPLVRRNIERGIWTEADGEGAFYFVVDDEDDLDRVWKAVLKGRPDFLKTYLLYSEEYALRKDDPAFFGWKGLDPALLPEIVRRAHQAGLRVSTHVETAADFHHALVAGVDEIAHMPGFRGDARVQLPDPATFQISEADARLAARRGTVVVTTVGGVRGIDPAGPDGLLRRQFDSLHSRNLRLLRDHGVRLALGSDDYGDTSVGEAMYLHSLGVFDNLALLRLWSEATPQAIFPGRSLGCLQEGCEASFLVLRGDPIADFDHVREIVLRVKQGHILAGPATEPTGHPAVAGLRRDAAPEALNRRQDALFDALSARDPDRAASFFADDGVLHVAGMPPIEGSVAIRRFYGNVFRHLTRSTAVPLSTHVSASGDLAFGTGVTVNEFNSPEGPVEYEGKYVLVWKMTAGEWWVQLYGISSNQPEAAGQRR